jgi:hypothetical protein
MRLNLPTDHGWQNKSGALGSLDLGPEEEEPERSAITIENRFGLARMQGGGEKTSIRFLWTFTHSRIP